MINHGPIIGWAIQKGHRIQWSAPHNNYLPIEEGTPQDGIGSGDEGTGSIGTGATAEAMQSNAEPCAP